MSITLLTVLLLVVATALAGLLIFSIYRRRSRLPAKRLAKCAHHLLHQVLIPTGKDGDEAEIQLEYTLLCPRGVVVLDLKNIDGNVFGSDAMQEWAVITGKSRFGFANPQDGLFDRVAAVKALLPDVPVHGYVAFGSRTQFAKGMPAHTALFDELVAELQQELAASSAPVYEEEWQKLQSVARAVPLN